MNWRSIKKSVVNRCLLNDGFKQIMNQKKMKSHGKLRVVLN
jgi:hypothetical protein